MENFPRLKTQPPHWMGKVMVTALSVGLAQSLLLTSPAVAFQPFESLSNFIQTWPSWFDRDRFETGVEPIALAADVPLLDLDWFETLCRDFVALQGKQWDTLTFDQQLAVADDVLQKLTSILAPNSVEYMRHYNDAFVASAIAPRLEEFDDDIFLKANQRVLKAFPELQNNLEEAEATEFNQILVAALVDEMYGR